MPLGLYISVPFCRTKCTYCNFASDVFSRAVFERYISRVCSDIERAAKTADEAVTALDRAVDSIYLGGGTPTLLDTTQLERLFVTIRQNFDLQQDTEITVECAPGTLAPGVLENLQRCGVNRVSLGVQSFIDKEAASVGRLHKRDTVLCDIERLRSAGISNINLDLIAGLPHQTPESWDESLSEVIASGVPHASVYVLEVDEDSRLGRELIASGTKYHAHFVPDDELTADMYEHACNRFNAAGLRQYEISNFAHEGLESQHNLKYWTRQPYLGFGVDAHSMLLGSDDGVNAIRFASPESLEKYVAGGESIRNVVSRQEALEEEFFLGLRLIRGVDLRDIATKFGASAVSGFAENIAGFIADGLLARDGDVIRLTRRGRLVSNEVFAAFIGTPELQTPESR
ncbi:MAG: putative oxygen-independent coproporphyrinogen oxidase [Acidobacteriaceae bacterium]|nr:putative oxygen-independent coproporphyrinogen oxidase [Acidobacteriaceae bacterium]